MPEDRDVSEGLPLDQVVVGLGSEIRRQERDEDPGEQRNLEAERPGDVLEYRALLARHRDDARAPWGEAPVEVELDEMRLNQLRALGYVIKQ